MGIGLDFRDHPNLADFAKLREMDSLTQNTCYKGPIEFFTVDNLGKLRFYVVTVILEKLNALL